MSFIVFLSTLSMPSIAPSIAAITSTCFSGGNFSISAINELISPLVSDFIIFIFTSLSRSKAFKFSTSSNASGLFTIRLAIMSLLSGKSL
ncbi:TPA: hypothetical protein KOP06_001916 [Clostridioides difficile]|nr:hypothetical protein [Clostridioides difficile]